MVISRHLGCTVLSTLGIEDLTCFFVGGCDAAVDYRIDADCTIAPGYVDNVGNGLEIGCHGAVCG